jgi:hypothetical protein
MMKDSKLVRIERNRAWECHYQMVMVMGCAERTVSEWGTLHGDSDGVRRVYFWTGKNCIT